MNFIKNIIVAIALIALSIMGTWLYLREDPPQKQIPNTAIIEHKLQMISELSTASYIYTDFAVDEKEAKKLLGMSVYGTSSKIVYLYRGVIKAGIDLKEAKVELNGNELTIYLPKAKITSHEVDPRSIHIANQSDGFFNAITIEDFNKFAASHRDSTEAVAIHSGLLEAARENTVDALSLITDPLVEDGLIVNIKDLREWFAMPPRD